MPLMKCNLENLPGWRWGDSGKCYLYKSGDKKSEVASKLLAIKQGFIIAKSSGESFKP